MHHPPPLDVEQPKKKPRMGKDSEGAIRFGLWKVLGLQSLHSRPSLARTYCKQDKEIQHYAFKDILLFFFTSILSIVNDSNTFHVLFARFTLWVSLY